MIITPETKEDIAAIIAAEFRTFGGGRGSSFNPIAEALKDKEPTFASGVDVQSVVDRVIELSKHLKQQ